LGSEYEAEMLREAASLVYAARYFGLLSILWMYPRGKAVTNEKDPKIVAGATGVAAALGTDFAKVNAPKAEGMSSAEALKEAVAAAGRTKVICAGGGHEDVQAFLQSLHDQIHIGGAGGNATGRNIHQRSLQEAIKFCNAISAITFDDKSVDDALAIYNAN
jgi:fructose-bisphosphate aldolase/6-deoxy-5-ketofructose 1-phosphate synthase